MWKKIYLAPQSCFIKGICIHIYFSVVFRNEQKMQETCCLKPKYTEIITVITNICTGQPP